MVRKTKEEAEQTRLNILDAARKVFTQHGVSRTSLKQIAEEAGVTRGAIYWHFESKEALFFAMKEQVAVPLLDKITLALNDNDTNPIQAIETFLLGFLDTLENDQRTQQTLEITSSKCEYVEEFATLLSEQVKSCQDFISRMEGLYEQAEQQGLLAANINPRFAALETCCFLSGVIKLWLADHDGSIIRQQAVELIKQHVQCKLAN